MTQTDCINYKGSINTTQIQCSRWKCAESFIPVNHRACHKGCVGYMNKVCEHDSDKETRIGYFTHNEIERKAMYCPKCGELLDYYPQYNEDKI